MRRDEHTPIYRCKDCGAPENNHPYRHPFIPEVFVDPVLTKISLDCATMDLKAPKTDWPKRFMALAEHIAQWSKDPSTKVGAVIVNDLDRKVVALGYNGFPRGVEDTPERYADREEKYSRVVHAELNAILNSTVPLDDPHTLYSTLPPCCECAKAIIQSGIGMVVVPGEIKLTDLWESKWQVAKEMFSEAGVAVEYV